MSKDFNKTDVELADQCRELCRLADDIIDRLAERGYNAEWVHGSDPWQNQPAYTGNGFRLTFRKFPDKIL